MNKLAEITLKDGLLFETGAAAPAPYTCIIFCRVPPDWLDGDQLRMEKAEAVYDKLYGQDWRSGNDDGSRYIVRSVVARILPDEEEQAGAWQDARSDREYRYWFFDVSADGTVRAVKAAEL